MERGFIDGGMVEDERRMASVVGNGAEDRRT